VNPTNELGLQYTVFKQAVLELALSNPAKYYAIRKDAFESLLMKQSDELYDKIYSLLSEGKVNGTSIMPDLPPPTYLSRPSATRRCPYVPHLRKSWKKPLTCYYRKKSVKSQQPSLHSKALIHQLLK
jgi:hypothetical protein